MLSLTSAEIVAQGTGLHYYRTGGDKPPLLLVHGLTDDGLCWTPVAEVLSRTLDIVMVDVRGHGKSEAPEGGYTLRVLAAELADFIQGAGLQKPILLGHSMGAISALVLAALFPDLPRQIILEDPPPFWNYENISPEQVEHRNGFIDWVKQIKRRTRDELLAEGRNTNPQWSAQELSFWTDSKHRCSPLITQLALPEDVPSLDFPALMGSIRCPVQFISANCALGALASDDDIAMLQAWIPQLRISHIANAGHNIRREQFSPYMEVVQKVLTSFDTA
jgi:N-formylmaleamate deformylase